MQPIQTYQDALDYLYSFINHDRKPARTPHEARHNLDRTRALLAAVGHPEHRLRTVVVAGTKGKGSTAAMLESIVRQAGYRTGLWISPHLNSYRERIQIDRSYITQEQLIAGVRRLQPIADTFDVATYGSPSTFELGFALALRHFADQQVDLALLEVGLGGRYDCANVVHPLVTLVASISYDHTNVLGATLSKIAYDKAGTFKPGIPAITVPQPQEAARMLAQVAHEVGTPLHLAAEPRPEGLQCYETEPPPPAPNAPPPLPEIAYPVEPATNLRGAFQQENARLACGAAVLLRQNGLLIPDDALRRGLATVHWPGRLELVQQSPLLVLDGAHNGHSAQRLAAALRAEFRYSRLFVILGVSRDKHIEAILAALLPHTHTLVLTHSRHPRAYTDLDKIAAMARGSSPPFSGPILFTGDIPDALEEARALAAPDDLICVTGSLFVVGAARETLGVATICD